MKTKTNRIVSILLTLCAVCCIFAVMSMTVNAAGEVCEIGTAQYYDLTSALAAVPTGGTKQTTIKLLADITYPMEYCTMDNKKITFDLNGHDLIFTGSLWIDNGSNIDYIGKGKFEVNRTTSYTALYLLRGSTCKLTGVTINDTAGIGTGRYAEGIYCYDYSTVIVNGDVLAISNGDISSNSYAIYAIDNGTVTVNGDVIALGNGYGALAFGGSTVTINGTMTTNTIYINVGYIYKTQADFTLPTTKTGFLTYTDGTSTVWVKEPMPVCEIGTTQYYFLANALAAVPTGGITQTVIRLLTNITYTTDCYINNKKITFDLNGHDLIFTGEFDIRTNSYVDYIGKGKFEVNRSIYGVALYVDNSICKLTMVTINDVAGIGTGRYAIGIHSGSNSTVIVNGNVYAESNGEIGSYSGGISASYSSNVTVNGNITALGNGYGASAYYATITVNGTITVDNETRYVVLNNADKTQAQYTSPTTKTNYITYADGISTVWVLVSSPPNYTVTYDANGGEFFPDGTNTIQKTLPANTTLISLPNNPTRIGYTFTGWNTMADGSGTAFTITTIINNDITVYAQWTAIPTFKITGKVISLTGDTRPTIVMLKQNNYTVYTAINQNGEYVFNNVIPGDYTLVITKVSYLSYTKTSLSVSNQNIEYKNVTLIPGDIDEDGHISYNDFLIFLANYNKQGAGIANIAADINGDGYVDYNDFITFLSGYGKSAIVE